jgi:hypothetical protein
VTGGIARVEVVDPPGIVELVDGEEAPGAVVPDSFDELLDEPLGEPLDEVVSTTPEVQAPTTRSMAKRMVRRRSIFDQVIGR